MNFLDQRGEFQDRSRMLSERANSAYTAIPDAGTATYRGEASMVVGDLSEAVAVYGDATVTANFDNSTVAATLENFGGFDRTQEYSNYTGSLVFEDGAIGVERPNDVRATITGTLQGEDYDIGVDAQFEGDFRGTPIVGIMGDTVGSESVFTMDGNEVPGGIVVSVSN